MPGYREPMRIAGKVGHYGCEGGGKSRLVRVGLIGDSTKPPRFAMVECPACGNEHRVELTWRQPREADEGREPEVFLEAIE